MSLSLILSIEKVNDNTSKGCVGFLIKIHFNLGQSPFFRKISMSIDENLIEN
jgi:hypothetical protein